MSSMTLKQFMTRGMEKDAADFQFNVGNTPGPFVTFNKDKDYVTNLNQTALGVYGPHLFNGLGKDYWDAVSDYDKQRLIAEASGLLQEVVPKVLSGDTQLLNQLDKSKAIKDLFRMSGISGDKKPSEFVTELMSDMTKDSGMMKFMLGASKNNPGLFKAFAHKYILQSMMKKMGLDPSKVYDYAPGLKDYDMNQHLPGMAAAFGIPFGIGALMGKPGWGLLLGLLGAGGYGYYKYNQMAGLDHPFSAPPSSQYLAEPAYEEKTEPIPASAEEPASAPDPAHEAPAAEAASAESAVAGNSGGSGDDEIQGLEDTLNLDIEPLSDTPPSPEAARELPAPAPTPEVAPSNPKPSTNTKTEIQGKVRLTDDGLILVPDPANPAPAPITQPTFANPPASPAVKKITQQ